MGIRLTGWLRSLGSGAPAPMGKQGAQKPIAPGAAGQRPRLETGKSAAAPIGRPGWAIGRPAARVGAAKGRRAKEVLRLGSCWAVRSGRRRGVGRGVIGLGCIHWRAGDGRLRLWGS